MAPRRPNQSVDELEGRPFGSSEAVSYNKQLSVLHKKIKHLIVADIAVNGKVTRQTYDLKHTLGELTERLKVRVYVLEGSGLVTWCVYRPETPIDGGVPSQAEKVEIKEVNKFDE